MEADVTLELKSANVQATSWVSFFQFSFYWKHTLIEIID